MIDTVVAPVQQQPHISLTPEGTSLPRVTLLFTLSGPRVQQDLLHEFSLHHDVTATAAEYDNAPAIHIETSDAEGAVWEVRSTVGLFDDRASEINGQA